MALKLSIVIVNYNVRYFLEHCLNSVLEAMDHRMEVIVVDNASTDGSRDMMAERFPEVKYVYESVNHGFSKANNIGISMSEAEFVLLLNPDTIVKKETFKQCITFFDQHPDCGGLGIHMIDGQGEFLPESKRGLPTPSAAFYKIFGWSSLFPKSKIFGKYHLGYLPEFKTNEVEILSGAYMMMRKSVLEKSGLLDEDFFMYGEDIDLSYRIIKAGYKNYYFPEAEIIHYKGESTKKGSINYVFVFYRAMIIFAKKHFDKGQASLFGLLINIAIYFRAFLAVLSRVFNRSWQIALDFTIIYGSFLATTKGYEFYQTTDFLLPFVSIALPSYAVIMVFGLVFSGSYDKPLRWSKLFQGWLISAFVLLSFYSLLPESYRFSRAVIVIGILAAFSVSLMWRWVLIQLHSTRELISLRTNTRRLVVGSPKSLERVKLFYEKEQIESEFIAGICISENDSLPKDYVGYLNRLTDAISIFKIEEIIWCSDDLDYTKIIDQIKASKQRMVSHLIASKNAEYLIGSQRVITAHHHRLTKSLRMLNLTAINRNKRLADLLTCLFIMLTLPICILFIDQKSKFLDNLIQVFRGRKSWIGLDPRGLTPDFPTIKAGVIHPLIHVILNLEMSSTAIECNVNYLEKHSVLSDFRLILSNFQLLGN